MRASAQNRQTRRSLPDRIGYGLVLLSLAAYMAQSVLLPLVGPAGVQTPHARQNFLAFLGVGLVAWALALAALAVQWPRRGNPGASRGYGALGLSCLGALVLWATLTGWFHQQ